MSKQLTCYEQYRSTAPYMGAAVDIVGIASNGCYLAGESEIGSYLGVAGFPLYAVHAAIDTYEKLGEARVSYDKGDYEEGVFRTAEAISSFGKTLGLVAKPCSMTADHLGLIKKYIEVGTAFGRVIPIVTTVTGSIGLAAKLYQFKRNQAKLAVETDLQKRKVLKYEVMENIAAIIIASIFVSSAILHLQTSQCARIGRILTISGCSLSRIKCLMTQRLFIKPLSVLDED